MLKVSFKKKKKKKQSVILNMTHAESCITLVNISIDPAFLFLEGTNHIYNIPTHC